MNTNLLIKTVILYVLAFLADYVATVYNFKFMWLVFLPIATAANTLFFDLLLGHVDFSALLKLKDTDRGIHTVALTVLSAGFAIATAIFFK